MENEEKLAKTEKVEKALERLTVAQVFEASRQMLGVAQQCFNGGAFTQGQAFCDRVVDLGDPYFVTEALFLSASWWRRVGSAAQEREAYTRVAALPEEQARIADPLKLGIALWRSGHVQEAQAHYEKQLEFAPNSWILQGNLAELLLTVKKYADSMYWSGKLITSGSVEGRLMGGVFKGVALCMQGFAGEAGEEFKRLGAFIVTLGGFPAGFSWDFSDSQQILSQVRLAVASLVFDAVANRIAFPEFVSRWSAMFPVQGALPTQS